jgi:hypothetical protein
MKRFKDRPANHRLKLKDNTTSPATMFDTFPDQVLGAGYSTDMQMAAMQCLNGSVSFINGPSGYIAFSNSVSFNEFMEQLVITYSTSKNLWIFSSSSESSYAKYVQDDAYSQTFYFFEIITLPTKQFNPSGYSTQALNPFGLGAYNVGPDQFRTTCGDQFLAQENLGAGLFAAMQLNFYSLSDRQTFESHSSSSFAGITDAFSQIQTVVNANALTGYLSFAIYQEGGDATKLAQVMTKDPQGNYYLTTCSFNNLNACNGTINAVLSYAANNFPGQVGFSNGQIIGNAIAQGFANVSYTELGLNVGNSTVNPLVEVARTEIEALYFSMEAQNVMVSKILTSTIAPYIEPGTSAILANFTQSYNYNVGLILNPINGIIGCYLTPQNCLAIAYNINTQLAPINSTQISQIVNEFQTGYLFSFGPNNYAPNINVSYTYIGNNLYMPPIFVTEASSNDASRFLFTTKKIIENNNSLTMTTDPSILYEFCWNACNINGKITALSDSLNFQLINPNTYQGTFQLNVTEPERQPLTEEFTLTLVAVDSGIF